MSSRRPGTSRTSRGRIPSNEDDDDDFQGPSLDEASRPTYGDLQARTKRNRINGSSAAKKAKKSEGSPLHLFFPDAVIHECFVKEVKKNTVCIDLVKNCAVNRIKDEIRRTFLHEEILHVHSDKSRCTTYRIREDCKDKVREMIKGARRERNSDAHMLLARALTNFIGSVHSHIQELDKVIKGNSGIVSDCSLMSLYRLLLQVSDIQFTQSVIQEMIFHCFDECEVVRSLVRCVNALNIFEQCEYCKIFPLSNILVVAECEECKLYSNMGVFLMKSVVFLCRLEICKMIGKNINWDCIASSLISHYAVDTINRLEARDFLMMVLHFTEAKWADWTVVLYAIGDATRYQHNEKHYCQVLGEFIKRCPLPSTMTLFGKIGHTLHRVALDRKWLVPTDLFPFPKLHFSFDDADQCSDAMKCLMPSNICESSVRVLESVFRVNSGKDGDNVRNFFVIDEDPETGNGIFHLIAEVANRLPIISGVRDLDERMCSLFEPFLQKNDTGHTCVTRVLTKKNRAGKIPFFVLHEGYKSAIGKMLQRYTFGNPSNRLWSRIKNPSDLPGDLGHTLINYVEERLLLGDCCSYDLLDCVDTYKLICLIYAEKKKVAETSKWEFDFLKNFDLRVFKNNPLSKSKFEQIQNENHKFSFFCDVLKENQDGSMLTHQDMVHNFFTSNEWAINEFLIHAVKVKEELQSSILPITLEELVQSIAHRPDNCDERENDVCSICFQEMLNRFQDDDDDPTKTTDTGFRMMTACRHYFHERCLMNQMKFGNRCPMCRSSITPLKYKPTSVIYEHVANSGLYFYAVYQSYPKTSKTKPLDVDHDSIYDSLSKELIKSIVKPLLPVKTDMIYHPSMYDSGSGDVWTVNKMKV